MTGVQTCALPIYQFMPSAYFAHWSDRQGDQEKVQGPVAGEQAYFFDGIAAEIIRRRVVDKDGKGDQAQQEDDGFCVFHLRVISDS